MLLLSSVTTLGNFPDYDQQDMEEIHLFISLGEQELLRISLSRRHFKSQQGNAWGESQSARCSVQGEKLEKRGQRKRGSYVWILRARVCGRLCTNNVKTRKLGEF